jgi:hypothetical protein
MTASAQLLSRIARKEMAEVARARHDLAARLRDLRAAEALGARLGQLLAQRRDMAAQAASVAELTERRRLVDQLAAEAIRCQTRLATLRAEAEQAATALARLEHRRRMLDEAALAARRAERAEAEAKAEAAQMHGLRR